MKKIILGVVLGLLLLPAIHEIAYEIVDDVPYRLEYGIAKPFQKRCTKDVSLNGHGWIFINREYFSCGTVSILISDLLYGEYTNPRDIELEKQACKKCRL